MTAQISARTLIHVSATDLATVIRHNIHHICSSNGAVYVDRCGAVEWRHTLCDNSRHVELVRLHPFYDGSLSVHALAGWMQEEYKLPLGGGRPFRQGEGACATFELRWKTADTALPLDKYIEQLYGVERGARTAFADAQGVGARQVGRWSSKGYIVVGATLYAPIRKLR
ncbi:hypothetical protein KAR91_72775 [Candidatus Pacearchaeota archaeon]|nr:hypothetical protein [Candidatus Pacearchaeota archaeon]